MQENKKEKAAREKVLKAATFYYEQFHKKMKYSKGDKIPYAARVYDEKEIVNSIDASLDFWLTTG